MIRLEKVTMVSTPFNTFVFIKVKIDHLSQYLITKFKMQNGQQMVRNLLWFQDSNQLLQLCMMPMVIHNLNLERNSETPLSYVHSVRYLWLVDLVILQKERWTSGTWRLKKKLVKQNSHVLLKFNGHHVDDIWWILYYMIDSK